MKLVKLEHKFYAENSHLKEALDNHQGNWEKGKIRGYGIVLVNYGQHQFAIPLRSNINHKACFLTSGQNSQSNNIRKGLDFSKALLIKDPNYISRELFKISDKKHDILKSKEHYIKNKFNQYIEKYIRALLKSDQRILNLPEYRFTTLQNYHLELTNPN